MTTEIKTIARASRWNNYVELGRSKSARYPGLHESRVLIIPNEIVFYEESEEQEAAV